MRLDVKIYFLTGQVVAMGWVRVYHWITGAKVSALFPLSGVHHEILNR